MIIIFAISLSLDGFFVSLSYGLSNIKIRFIHSILIGFINCIILAFSLFTSNLLQTIISKNICAWIGGILFIILGIGSILQTSKQEHHSITSINCRNSISLAIALSLDSLLSGIGFGLINENYINLLLCVFLIHLLALQIGYYIGVHIHLKKELHLSWISGTMIILLGIYKLCISFL